MRVNTFVTALMVLGLAVGGAVPGFAEPKSSTVPQSSGSSASHIVNAQFVRFDTAAKMATFQLPITEFALRELGSYTANDWITLSIVQATPTSHGLVSRVEKMDTAAHRGSTRWINVQFVSVNATSKMLTFKMPYTTPTPANFKVDEWVTLTSDQPGPDGHEVVTTVAAMAPREPQPVQRD